jgi:hypothetical protein
MAHRSAPNTPGETEITADLLTGNRSNIIARIAQRVRLNKHPKFWALPISQRDTDDAVADDLRRICVPRWDEHPLRAACRLLGDSSSHTRVRPCAVFDSLRAWLHILPRLTRAFRSLATFSQWEADCRSLPHCCHGEESAHSVGGLEECLCTYLR